MSYAVIVKKIKLTVITQRAKQLNFQNFNRDLAIVIHI